MRTLALVALACLMLVLQSAFWRHLPFDLTSPDVWALFAVYLGLNSQSEGGAPTAAGAALVIGLVFDSLAGAPTGLFATASVAIALVSALLSQRLLLRGRITIAGTGFVASLVGALVILVFLALEGAELRLGLGMFLIIFLQAFMSALIAPPLFWLLRRVEARTSRQRARDLAREGVLR